MLRSKQASHSLLKQPFRLVRFQRQISDTSATSVIPKTGQSISRTGFGAYRISSSSSSHLTALATAIQHGVNVIDTAAHFGDGHSEQAIGSFLSKTAHSRDHFCIISKAGFVTPHVLQNLESNRVAPEHISTIPGSNVAHSIHPAAIEVQLQSSLNRLGTDYLDIYMLNCPERLLHVMSEAQLQTALCRSLDYFANQVERKKIRGFGITSSNPEWLIQHDILKDETFKPYLHAIEVPANLCEHAALSPASLDRILDLNLALFTHRTFQAIATNGIMRLTMPQAAPELLHQQEERLISTLGTQFENLQAIEEDIVDIAEDSTISNKFVWSVVLSENLERLVKNPVASQHYLLHHLLPKLNQDLDLLVKQIPDNNQVSDWVVQYRTALDSTSSTICDISRLRAVTHATEIRDLLALYLPGTRDWTLQRQCFSLIHAARAHVPGCVLVGMRSEQYVRELLSDSLPHQSLDPHIWRNIVESGVLEHITAGPSPGE